MAIRPVSLQGRFTFFLILPVMALLVVMGVAGFFYARDMLLDQWREAAILKLQRAAHQMDMHLIGIKEGVRLFHDTSGAQYDESFHTWALDRLTQQEGIVDVKLSWNRAEDSSAARLEAGSSAQIPGQGPRAMGKAWRLRRFHSASIRKITSPRFDAAEEHGTVSTISELLDERGQAIGRLEVVANFDFLFKHVVESGWWQSNKAYLVDESGRILVCTVPGRHGMLFDTDDLLEKATFKAMAGETSGTVRGEGHPPSEISGFYRLEEAPWFLVMIAPGREILSPIIQFRWIYSIFAIGFIGVIVALIRLVTGRLASEIKKVSEAALRLSQGEFGEPLPVKSRDEVGELTRSFNLMKSQLQERLHLKEAMNLAMEVQQNLLPGSPPPLAGPRYRRPQPLLPGNRRGLFRLHHEAGADRQPAPLRRLGRRRRSRNFGRPPHDHRARPAALPPRPTRIDGCGGVRHQPLVVQRHGCERQFCYALSARNRPGRRTP